MSGGIRYRVLLILTDYLYTYESCHVLVQILYPETSDRVRGDVLLGFLYSRVRVYQRRSTLDSQDPQILERVKVSISRVYPKDYSSCQRVYRVVIV